MGAGGAPKSHAMICFAFIFNGDLRRGRPIKCKNCPQLEAITVTAKQLIFLDSALDLEEKMPNNLWGVSSSSKNPIFLKCGPGSRKSEL